MPRYTFCARKEDGIATHPQSGFYSAFLKGVVDGCWRVGPQLRLRLLVMEVLSSCVCFFGQQAKLEQLQEVAEAAGEFSADADGGAHSEYPALPRCARSSVM